MTRVKSPGPGYTSPAGATTKIGRHQATALTHEDSRLAVARATAHAPAGRRARWLLIVEHCPLCRGAHHHLSAVPDSRMRRAGCGSRGRRYLVVVAPRVAVVA